MSTVPFGLSSRCTHQLKYDLSLLHAVKILPDCKEFSILIQTGVINKLRERCIVRYLSYSSFLYSCTFYPVGKFSVWYKMLCHGKV